jgi:hypothetical protein
VNAELDLWKILHSSHLGLTALDLCHFSNDDALASIADRLLLEGKLYDGMFWQIHQSVLDSQQRVWVEWMRRNGMSVRDDRTRDEYAFAGFEGTAMVDFGLHGDEVRRDPVENRGLAVALVDRAPAKDGAGGWLGTRTIVSSSKADLSW